MFSLTSTADLFCDAGLAIFYPQPCSVCGLSVESRFDGVACSDCWQRARLISPAESLCYKCGAPMPGTQPAHATDLLSCHRCDDASYTASRACGLYEGALRASVLALKREPHVARTLLLLMREVCRREPLAPATVMLPVPLHPQREQQRGFNQAAVLAHALARLIALPVIDSALLRTRPTGRHRAGMDALARRESVERVFTVAQPKLIAGERVLLVDDVFTTGATASACASVLLAAGAAAVLVLTIARPAR